MEKPSLTQDYLAKADDAEGRSRSAADLVTRNYWKRLAGRYRRLAIFVKDRRTKGISC
jgi:hypothetical protein